jgi:DNA-binding response OmpR family regulator
LCLLIEKEGLAVEVAHTAGQARARLAERDYAALTLDLSLPDESGLDLVRELRRSDGHRDLPIIVISAKALEGKRIINGDAVGVIGWLGKPIDTDLLGAALHQAVSRPRGDGRSTILYVEDDPDLLALVEKLLEGRADVVGARSVAEARACLARQRFDLAILDLTLPDGSGLELLPLLREQLSAPAVMVLAAGEVGSDIAGRIEDTLVKSRTTNEELVGRILDLVKGRR